MYWKLALAQHPMYLLIKEDTQSIERMPPWGLPGIELYIERVGRNIAAIRQNPALKIGFEWSGLELEMLSEDDPEVFAELCALAHEGRVAFYNGTYAQPHLQTLSSEANYRQFEYGMRVYKELVGHPVVTYAHQETSINDQVPQLLSAFGFEYAVLPLFPSTLAWLDEGEMLLLDEFGHRFVHGHEFVNWVGLDGTQIPLYLARSVDETPDISEDAVKGDPFEAFLAEQEILGLLHEPPIIMSIPDLIETDDDWLERRQEFDLVLLDDALRERLQEAPPRARVRFYANWSYIEGIRAEELSRANRQAEDAVLRAEALNALAYVVLGRTPHSTDAIWKAILKAQHHDVYVFAAAGLRKLAIPALQSATLDAARIANGAAEAIIKQVDRTGQTGTPLVVFNSVPHAQTALITLDTGISNPVVKDRLGKPIPIETTSFGDGKSKIRFLAQADGIGYQTFWMDADGETADEFAAPKNQENVIKFENDHYRATLQPDGTFSSLVLLQSDAELLTTTSVRGNQLAAMDSTGLAPSNHELHVRERYRRLGSGPELEWMVFGKPQVTRSPLGLRFHLSGDFGPKISAELEISFYKELPRIDVIWRFEFDTASVGTFYRDDTKLRVHWPLSFSGNIQHDIAFGVIPTHAGRPFFPANWVDVSDGEHGLAYMHQGTLKHWVRDDVLVNLLAYGEDTEAMSARRRSLNWPKAFDQRLRGRHQINYSIYPHAGDWKSADVIGVARAYNSPPVAYLTSSEPGSLRDQTNVLSLSDPELVATAVKAIEDGIMCRLFSVGAEPKSVQAATKLLHPADLLSLQDEPLAELQPYQIGSLNFKPSLNESG